MLNSMLNSPLFRRLFPQRITDVSDAPTQQLPLTLLRRPAREWWMLGGLLVVALAIRLYYAPNPGFFYDLHAFVVWGQAFNAHPLTVYSQVSTANYPPLAIYLCWFGVKVMPIVNPLLHQPIQYNIFLPSDLPILEKIPTITSDLILITAFFLMARRYLSLWWSFGLAAAYALSPAVILIGAVWGQMDGIFALCLVLACWFAIQRQPVWAGIFFGMALMLKPLPVVLTPVLLVYLWQQGWRELLRGAAAITATCVVICLPYMIPPKLQVFVLLHNITSSLVPIDSSYAYNLWWALNLQTHHSTQHVLGGLSAAAVGWTLFAVVLAVVCLVVWRLHTPVALIVGSALVMYAFFAFTTGQHERYIFPVLPLFLLATIWQRRYLFWYAFTTVTCYSNMLSIILRRYHPKSRLSAYPLAHPWILRDFSWLVVLGFCIAFALFLYDAWSMLRPEPTPPPAPIALADAETLHMPRIQQTGVASSSAPHA